MDLCVKLTSKFTSKFKKNGLKIPPTFHGSPRAQKLLKLKKKIINFFLGNFFMNYYGKFSKNSRKMLKFQTLVCLFHRPQSPKVPKIKKLNFFGIFSMDSDIKLTREFRGNCEKNPQTLIGPSWVPKPKIPEIKNIIVWNSLQWTLTLNWPQNSGKLWKSSTHSL